ncbi:MAG: phosphatase [Desulfurococcales archaeon ex4484_58]|nr:MAG: phosphatase [Desulfurococcales archaeon ex4484_58]
MMRSLPKTEASHMVYIVSLKIIILDYDLTLMDNICDFYLSFNEAYHKYVGKTISFHEFYKAFVNDQLINIIPDNIDQEKLWKYMRKEICRSRFSRLNEGVHYFLYYTDILGLKKIIVSGRGCHPKYIYEELRRHGILEYISGVYTFFDQEILGGVEKVLFDKSWLLKYIIKKYKINASDTVYIGDYKLDYYSSLEVGVNFIGLTSIPERIILLKRIGVKRLARNFYEALLHVLDILRKTTQV